MPVVKREIHRQIKSKLIGLSVNKMMKEFIFISSACRFINPWDLCVYFPNTVVKT